MIVNRCPPTDKQLRFYREGEILVRVSTRYMIVRKSVDSFHAFEDQTDTSARQCEAKTSQLESCTSKQQTHSHLPTL
jgi:hypothetical protein